MAYTIAEKAIRFRHPGYNPDRAQLITQHFIQIHARVFSNLANRQSDRQTDRQTRANAFTSSFVGGNKCLEAKEPLSIDCVSSSFFGRFLNSE